MEGTFKKRKYRTYLHSDTHKIPRSTNFRKRKLRDEKSVYPKVSEASPSPTEDVCNAQNVSDSEIDIVNVPERYNSIFIQNHSLDIYSELDNDIELSSENVDLVEDLYEEIDEMEDFDVHLDSIEIVEPCIKDRDFYSEKVIDSASVTFHDLAVLLLSAKSKFNLSAVALNYIIKITALILPEDRRLLNSLNQLYSYVNEKDTDVRKHFYCGFCQFYIGMDQSTESQCCPSCNKLNNYEYFVEIPLENELKGVVERNLKHLSYRDEKNTDHNCITDVYDGELYKKHMKDGGFLQDNNNISLLGNTDGVAVFKSSSFSVWPVYVVVNELPPKIRFRKENRILCGLWFGKKKPNFTTFFKPFTETVWNLFTDGFQITDPVNKEMKTVKAILLHMTCDSPAKCIFQDFMQYNAYFGCPYCLDPGAYDKEGRSHVYPFSVESENGFGVERTHESTVVYAQEARVNLAQGKKKFAVKGVKGFSWAFSLPRFDIINSMCLDYMHAVLLGVMKQLLQLWCRSSKEMYTLSNADYSIVQKRLQEIQPPNNITRVPRSLDEQKHWKASEYRSFLLFYGAACLYGVLDQVYFDHFMLLSDAIWLLLQECITKQELEQATSKLQYFCFQMATLYGSRSATFSVHLLLHIPTSVRYNGPLWCNSCFFFEDQNGELRQYFHSSQHPDSQVVRAASIVQTLPKMAEKMESGSPADFLYRSITVDRYKVVMEKWTLMALHFWVNQKR
ncbi:uncharacterized protein LOC132744372 isoform X2 [Ruditapes philippinarum]|uniref:uncharacterized protein LOC132744372 isoform X2 n=1 Tax=Ruditapes philippinarum TaxID=129788 RepID=UPI00295BA473|nr:uncharacterized protein LOC132744372 isoform X2 [Ruditapes philippinarum]